MEHLVNKGKICPLSSLVERLFYTQIAGSSILSGGTMIKCSNCNELKTQDAFFEKTAKNMRYKDNLCTVKQLGYYRYFD